jgi:signal transduction histidine kinase
MMPALWPRSLRGQMIALVLIGLAIAQSLGFVISRMQHQHDLQLLRDEYVLTRVTSVVHLLANTPQELHERIVRTASSWPLRLSIASEPVVDASTASQRSIQLQQQLAALLDANRVDLRIDLRPTAERDRPRQPRRPGAGHEHSGGRRRHIRRPATVLAIAVRLEDGRWLNAVSMARPWERFWQWPPLLSVGLTALILSVLMVLMVRRITRPLAQLAVAADRFGRGAAVPSLTEQGPVDIQETIRAFNRMRARLERFVQDRTRMLAAISHDLRTPITALRVRAELIDDLETRDKMLATLDEMQRMIEATLTFVREEAVQEDSRLIDFAALVESLCDDLSDTGKDVTFSGPGKTPYPCRVVSLKRALSNLIENAVIYGQRARVTLAEDREALRITIDDDGPGIAAADMERVFEPFVRLEASRSRETGGVGLGMAIARSIVRRHGGDIALENRPERGLRVTVRLPKDGTAHV